MTFFFTGPGGFVPLEAPFADAALLFDAPEASSWAFSDTVYSVVSDEALFAVASSSGGESFVHSTVWDTFIVFHPESEVADAGSLLVVGVDVPMSVSGAFEAVDAVKSGESRSAVTPSSGGHSFVHSTVSLGFGVLVVGVWGN
jgi:hypothetical protein